MAYKIEKNIPIQVQVGKVNELRELIKQMEVGDSMFLENNKVRASFKHQERAMNHEVWEQVYAELDDDFSYREYCDKVQKKFITRKEGTGFRVWRTK